MTTQNKIRIRNFDEEVLAYFQKKSEKIQYDNLDQDIINDIKNGVGAAYRYNDEELRNRVGQLESEKLDKTEADTLYPKKATVYSKEETDKKVSDLDDKLSVELDGKLDLETSKQLYIQLKDGVVTENLLSDDLIMKVNARYENQRPSESGSGGGVPPSEFNLLKVQVGNNTDSINSLKEYVNSNVMLNTDIILMGQLDIGVRDLIEGARQETEKIEMSDLSKDIQDKLAFAGEDNSDLIAMIDSLNKIMNAKRGEVLIGDGVDEAAGISKMTSTFIYLSDTIIIKDSQKLAEAEAWAKTQGILYVADLAANVLYEYIVEEDTWKVTSEYNATEKLAGRFCTEYQTQNIYFGIDEFEAIPIIKVTDFIRSSELSKYLSKNEAGTIYATKKDLEVYSDIHGEIERIDNSINQVRTEIASVNTTISDLEKRILKIEAESSVTQDSIKDVKTDIAGILSRLIALENK